VEELETVEVEEKKQYKRCRLREHYTCIKTQVSLEKSDVVDVLDDQQEKMWLVRHSIDTQKVLSLHVSFMADLVIFTLLCNPKSQFTL